MATNYMIDTRDMLEKLGVGWEDCETVYVRKEVAQEYLKLTTLDMKEQSLIHAAELMRRGIECDIKDLDDDVLKMKAAGLAYRDALTKAWNEESLKLEEAWTACQERIKTARDGIKAAEKMFAPLIDDVAAMDKRLESGVSYKVDRVLETVQRFADMSDDAKGMVRRLLDEEAALDAQSKDEEEST